AHRPADTAAAAAVVKAATSADYFLVRVAAVGALPTFPAAMALPALQTAMADTSAQVRAAAVEALGNLGGAQVAALARQAWTHDSSDAVRAGGVPILIATRNRAVKTSNDRRRTEIPRHEAGGCGAAPTLAEAWRARAVAGDRKLLYHGHLGQLLLADCFCAVRFQSRAEG